jgi:hypothetical protein
MRDMTYWKCVEDECKDETIYRFKGLCRSCTTYELGEPKNAVNRVKVTQSGLVIEAPAKLTSRAVSIEDYKTFRRSQKKMTKKQQDALIQAHQHTHNEHDGSHAHHCDDDCDHEPMDAKVMSIGESINEEE